FILSIVFLILSEGSFMVRHKRLNPQTLAAEFNQAFVQSDINLKMGLKWISDEFKDKGVGNLSSPDFIKELEAKHNDYGLSFFVFENEELVFWSNNNIPVYKQWVPSADKGLLELGNGWYFYRAMPHQNFTIVGLYTVKTNFKYQNRFLVNDFHQNLAQAENIFFLSHKRNDSFEILDSESEYAFSVELRSEMALITLQRGIWILSMLFAVTSIFLFLLGTFQFFSFRIAHGNPLVNLLGFAVSLLAFRFLLLIIQVPSVFYQGELFSPTLYAKSIVVPSLGDLFLYIVFSGIFIFFSYSQLKKVQIAKLGLPKAFIAGFFLLVLVVVFCWVTINLIRSLVIDSQLNLNVSILFDLDIFSVIGFFIIAGILFSFYFAVHLLFKIARLLFSNNKGYYLFLFIATLVLLAVDVIAGGLNILIWLLYTVALVVFEVFNRAPAHKAAFTPVIIALFLFSIISTFALYRFNTIREQERRKTLALGLATEQDHIAEYLFYDLEAALKSDNQLRNLIIKNPYNTNAIRQYLVHHYFYDFWGNYLFQVMVCRPEEMLLIRPQNFEMTCSEYFDAYISAFGKPTISPSFIYLENYTGRNSYIARLNFEVPSPGGNTVNYHLILEFDAKHVIRDMGLPELLIDDRININRDLLNYSYATYFEGELINKFGPYIYSIYLSTYGTFQNQFEFFIFDENEHLVYTKNNETQIIISKPVKTFLEGIAPLSFLFILFLTLIILLLIATGQKELGNWLQITFKRRVQAFMVGLVIVSVLAIGGVSTWFIVNFHNNKNQSILNEKSTSVLVDLESYLASEEILPDDYDYFLSDLLIDLNSVLFTDINLFGTDGFLVASSRPRIFEEEIVSQKMNPIAFAALRAEQKSQFIHKERIGNLEFYSSYVPLRNNQHDLLGYINLPYFAKQSELRNEISHFVLAFVNINLLLLFFAVIMALIISNHVTRPLQLIRDNLSRLQFGKTGPKISWARQDEIGQMINEYNRMIDELGISAERLARSEREFAWREMAKQVAHEIKNPLTPMRLSIQHLEKAWHENVPDWEKRLKRFSKTMVEQIDHLSLIAGEFSDFAKLPSGNNGLINLREFTPELLNLYDNLDNVVIELKMPRGNAPLLVIADKNQLHRVFNNLIRNSVQAYPKDQTAVIQVIYEKNLDFVKCHVRDFGCGISEKLKPNIFSPNFTTKSGGMGLGLSMVKTIVESMGGAISFQSKENEGTTFTFTLPVCEEKTDIDED
ncbi:MAG TPA: HAMP domain-containing sensor histidine kinase, partial [Bacteroidales bacterium]|nr:HAMP domain-containing sensor histidine kinase [Bacteroidales bacterium]